MFSFYVGFQATCKYSVLIQQAKIFLSESVLFALFFLYLSMASLQTFSLLAACDSALSLLHFLV